MGTGRRKAGQRTKYKKHEKLTPSQLELVEELGVVCRGLAFIQPWPTATLLEQRPVLNFDPKTAARLANPENDDALRCAQVYDAFKHKPRVQAVIGTPFFRRQVSTMEVSTYLVYFSHRCFIVYARYQQVALQDRLRCSGAHDISLPLSGCECLGYRGDQDRPGGDTPARRSRSNPRSCILVPTRRYARGYQADLQSNGGSESAYPVSRRSSFYLTNYLLFRLCVVLCGARLR